eukprot:maker-scaffold469_size162558-snap-gene-0.27 protein:Tk06425 transcript:maker-scaffold469_size162558-snap-gene-0.27-mRNA-1 annotation:"hypothetical protein DAPPUDRAFT_312603"
MGSTADPSSVMPKQSDADLSGSRFHAAKMVSAANGTDQALGLPANLLTSIEVEPVGRWFLSHWDRLHAPRGMSTSGLPSDSSETGSESGDEVEEEVEFEDDIAYLRSLDPKEIKEQDHYKVLGLAKIRSKATDEQIKKAHRAKVLRHHPDKRRAAGEDIRDDDDYFTCITKAAEILSHPLKRRAFDSVDPTFDDSVPDLKKNVNGNFYELFGPAFERNARWTVRKHVPKMGDEDTPREKLDKFYRFWYEFESWREFSYLDEEDKEKGSDRDERRWIEKNNKVQRAERKKEEMKRIRKLVDNAYNTDPRIIKFMEQDRQEKLDKKKAKQDAIKARKDEEVRARVEAANKERLENERKLAEEKVKNELAKKEREVKKNAIKKERKRLRNLVKTNDFFAVNQAQRVSHMAEVDRFCEILAIEELAALSSNLEAQDVAGGCQVFAAKVEELNDRLRKEKLEIMETATKGGGGDKSSKVLKEWSQDELALLIKAVNLFPAGTNNRWEVVASFINQHSKTPEIERIAKEVLGKAKEMQHGDFHLSSLKDDANKRAYENLEKGKKRDVKVESEASMRTESAAEVQNVNLTPWSPEEQQMLEQALKTYPANLGAERWARISAALPNRSKKDCMKRYKELAELVRAKKAAQAAAKKK